MPQPIRREKNPKSYQIAPILNFKLLFDPIKDDLYQGWRIGLEPYILLALGQPIDSTIYQEMSSDFLLPVIFVLMVAFSLADLTGQPWEIT